MSKEIKRIIKAAIARGWKLTKGGKHFIMIHPTGRKVPVSVSPSCPHAAKNAHRDLLRIEEEVCFA